MENIKGQTEVQELTGKDLIIGRNGAGKTTRMQSLALAISGYVPGAGKTVADTFKLASADTMKVGVETESFEMAREFVKTSKLNKNGETEVKISQKLFISPSAGETTIAKKEQRIKDELGDFPTMLDFGLFLSLTDNKKRDFIYELSNGKSEWNRDRVQAELENGVYPSEDNQEYYEVCKQNIADTMKQYREKAEVHEGLLAMTEYAKEQLKYWKKEKVNAEGAAKKLTELKNRGKETDRDLNNNQAKLDELQAKRETIVKEIAEAKAKNDMRNQKIRDLEKVTKEIETFLQIPDADYIEQLESAMKSYEQELEKVNNDDFEEKAKQITDNLAKVTQEIKEHTDVITQAQIQMATISSTIQSNVDIIKRIEESKGCCAFSNNIPCQQDFSGFMQQTNDILDDAYEKADALEEIIREATMKKMQAQEVEEKLKETQRALYKEVTEQKKKAEWLRANIGRVKAEIDGMKDREPMLASKKDLESHLKEDLENYPEIDITDKEDEKQLITEQIAQLQATIDEQKKVRNDLLNIKANIIDSQTAEFNVNAWKQISLTIGQGGIQGKMVAEMLNPLKEAMDEKIKETGIDQSVFFETKSDTGKEIFEFGFESGEVKRPFNSLSTGEQLIFMIFMMTTMIEKADPIIKILAIDNINDLDKENMSLVLRGLTKIGNTMDNIILSGVAEPKEEDLEGWKVWRL